ncbi:hypothetical protein [Panacagrimonas sp.]|uniref:hypothetical protein n=1 Tax=Panacagrimonas sp. TaxID=2480088 RepID=UPI003B517471
MNWERLMRWALWTSVPANFAVAGLFLCPGSATGLLAGLPQPPPHPLYGSMLALMVAAFGVAYAWLARHDAISRAFVAFATAGKFLAFLIALVLWLGGELSGRFALLMSGDLLFAAVFTAWLLDSRGRAR